MKARVQDQRTYAIQRLGKLFELVGADVGAVCEAKVQQREAAVQVLLV